jgi:phosphoribosylformimino-5-aminoimidazole carboxamide ribotide isomerase
VRLTPAIDLLGGKVVRLREGRRDEATVYSDTPWTIADDFARAGASLLHVVDLDGAFAGSPQQTALITTLVACGLPLQVGGGLRDEAAVEAVLAAGARYAVLGTAAVKDPALVERLCRQHPDTIVVAVDARDGMVAVEGWTQASTVSAVELATRAAGWGAAKILYTDVARDGLKRGPAVEATAALQRALRLTPVIASGGIGSLDDLRALQAERIAECVVGRALYDGAFTLAEGLAAC